MATVTLPHNLTANTLAQASQVMANLQAIATQVNGNLDATNLKDGAVTEGKVAAGAINTTELADEAVTNAKMAADSVGTTQLIDEAVTNAKMAADSVNTDQLVDGAVTGPKLASGSVDTTQLADEAVSSAKLADGAVTEEKLDVKYLSVIVDFNASAPIRVSGHPSLTVPAWPGDGQLRINHSQGNTDFAVQVTLEVDAYTFDWTLSPVVVVTSSTIDIYVVRMLKSTAVTSTGVNYVKRFHVALIPH